MSKQKYYLIIGLGATIMGFLHSIAKNTGNNWLILVVLVGVLGLLIFAKKRFEDIFIYEEE